MIRSNQLYQPFDILDLLFSDTAYFGNTFDPFRRFPPNFEYEYSQKIFIGRFKSLLFVLVFGIGRGDGYSRESKRIIVRRSVYSVSWGYHSSEKKNRNNKMQKKMSKEPRRTLLLYTPEYSETIYRIEGCFRLWIFNRNRILSNEKKKKKNCRRKIQRNVTFSLSCE
jgi:hypothetical protein